MVISSSSHSTAEVNSFVNLLVILCSLVPRELMFALFVPRISLVSVIKSGFRAKWRKQDIDILCLNALVLLSCLSFCVYANAVQTASCFVCN